MKEAPEKRAADNSAAPIPFLTRTGQRLWPTVDPATKPDYWRPPRLYASLFIVVLAFAIADYFLALAGVRLFDFVTWVTVEPVAEAAQGAVISAAAGAVGGAIALITLYVNLCERRYAQLLTINKDRDIAELQRLEEQFNQLSEDFAGTELLARVNAGIGLAHIARTPRPGVRDEILSKRREEDYPFFRRAANQLSAALHLYTERQARDEVRKAIGQLGALDDSDDQPLLHLLLNSVAEANRTAHRVFLETLAEGLAHGRPFHLLPIFSRIVRIIGDERRSDRLLRKIAISYECRKMVRLQAQLLGTSANHTTWTPDTAFLNRLLNVWQSLADTRDTLATLLRTRKTPMAMRAVLANLEDKRAPEEWRGLGATLRDVAPAYPNLKGCFLQGADLGGAQMQGADLRMAQMQWADLRMAQMQGADLSGARMQGVDLHMAQMQGADLSDARMQGAKLRLAYMQGADLEGTQMQGAYLLDAQMQGADLYAAQMQGVDLRMAQMQGADLSDARMQGAKLRWAYMQGARVAGCVVSHQDDGEEQTTVFSGAEVGEADFRYYEDDPTEREDERLIAWLRKHFPDQAKAIPEDREERFRRYAEMDRSRKGALGQ